MRKSFYRSILTRFRDSKLVLHLLSCFTLLTDPSLPKQFTQPFHFSHILWHSAYTVYNTIPVGSHHKHTHLMDITKDFLLKAIKTTSISPILLVSPNFLSISQAFTFGSNCVDYFYITWWWILLLSMMARDTDW